MTSNALQLPEILEEIFLNLPQKDLLIIQRVCRKWHDVIASCKALQVALFFSPTSRPPVSGMEFNPLLKSRFPAFFNGLWYHNRVMIGSHNLGLWNTTDWARGTPPSTDAIPILDPVRSAAYSRLEASWRRMIPCQPAPTELQVSYMGYKRQIRQWRLKSLNFRRTSGDHNAKQKVLTFGLIYDIIEDEWFRGDPRYQTNVSIDYFPADYNESSDDDGPRQSLREIYPQKPIGGVGRVVVHLNHVNMHNSAQVAMNQGMELEAKVFKDEFQCEGHIMKQDLTWDEEVEYP